ncbi:hypothetical protein DFH07DRAFT_780270 [Mycena maculata]|uniref:Uncharacterized protein n=1 Tax=Mycena maculata TaxID=230809 RepID=A0AAD7MVJ8_9AGAR|nr:hypothetical protein DFH07DRAFT_780270 [Mycena maculata]
MFRTAAKFPFWGSEKSLPRTVHRGLLRLDYGWLGRDEPDYRLRFCGEKFIHDSTDYYYTKKNWYNTTHGFTAHSTQTVNRARGQIRGLALLLAHLAIESLSALGYMRIIPCNGLDLASMSFVLTTGLIINTRLDTRRLGETILMLLECKFRRAGAKIALRNGVYEFQVPEMFGPEMPPVVFTAADYPELYQSAACAEIPTHHQASLPPISALMHLGQKHCSTVDTSDQWGEIDTIPGMDWDTMPFESFTGPTAVTHQSGWFDLGLFKKLSFIACFMLCLLREPKEMLYLVHVCKVTAWWFKVRPSSIEQATTPHRSTSTFPESTPVTAYINNTVSSITVPAIPPTTESSSWRAARFAELNFYGACVPRSGGKAQVVFVLPIFSSGKGAPTRGSSGVLMEDEEARLEEIRIGKEYAKVELSHLFEKHLTHSRLS